jgi:hypothetical protein
MKIENLFDYHFISQPAQTRHGKHFIKGRCLLPAYCAVGSARIFIVINFSRLLAQVLYRQKNRVLKPLAMGRENGFAADNKTTNRKVQGHHITRGHW